MTIIALFIAVVFAATLVFTELDNRIEKVLGLASSQLSFNLDNWKRHHRLACCLVNYINDTFGLIILILLGHIIFELTITTARIIDFIRMRIEEEKISVIVQLVLLYVHNFVILLVLSLSAWNLQAKVSNVVYLSLGITEPSLFLVIP